MEEIKKINWVIEVENLKKYFKGRPIHRAVDNLNFKIKEGSICGFIGPNGAGKTTTIKMILNLIKPTGGNIKILGNNIKNVKIKQYIGYMPEKPVLYKDMLPDDFLIYLGELSGMERERAKNKALQLLKYFNLEKHMKKKIGKYSSGMKQKLLLAQSLIHDPRILILDEPTTNMDPIGQAQFFNIVKHLAKEYKITFLISSHHLEELEKVVEEVIIINKGQLLLQSKVEDIKKNKSEEQLELSVSNINNVHSLLNKKLPKLHIIIKDNKLLIMSKDISKMRKQILKIIVENGEEILSITTRKKSLWELTLQILEGKK